MKFDVEKTNFINQIAQLKKVIEANDQERSKLEALINTRKGEADNVGSQVR